jgi:hypothetical protein
MNIPDSILNLIGDFSNMKFETKKYKRERNNKKLRITRIEYKCSYCKHYLTCNRIKHMEVKKVKISDCNSCIKRHKPIKFCGLYFYFYRKSKCTCSFKSMKRILDKCKNDRICLERMMTKYGSKWSEELPCESDWD